jgi:hypothetical protein
VRIQTTFESGLYNDGYVDNIALTLSGEAVIPTPPPRDQAPPPDEPLALSGLRVKPSKFRAARTGGPVAPGATTKKPVGGGSVSYSLNRAAPVRFTVARRSRGVVSGRKCVAPPRKPTTGKKPKACTRYVKVVSFSRASALGTNTFRLTGRISKRRALSPGSYRLTAVGQPPGAAPTPAANRTFTIVR